MKKLLLSVFLLVFAVAIAKAGGFIGNNKITPIADALKMPDNSYIAIQGNIIKQLSSDKYSFKDTTGVIEVEIDRENWNNIEASEKDTLELTGEIERKANSVYLDVDMVKKIKSK